MALPGGLPMLLYLVRDPVLFPKLPSNNHLLHEGDDISVSPLV